MVAATHHVGALVNHDLYSGSHLAQGAFRQDADHDDDLNHVNEHV